MDQGRAGQNKPGERLTYVAALDNDPEFLAQGQAGEKDFIGRLASTVFSHFLIKEP